MVSREKEEIGLSAYSTADELQSYRFLSVEFIA
jgi:hypothetical protein